MAESGKSEKSSSGKQDSSKSGSKDQNAEMKRSGKDPSSEGSSSSSGKGGSGSGGSEGSSSTKSKGYKDELADVELGQHMDDGYLGQDDIELGDSDKESKGGKSKSGSKLVHKAGLMGAAQAAMLVSKAAAFAMFKMFMQMLMAMLQNVAAAVSSLFASIMTVIGNIAAFVGVSVTIATFGVGFLAFIVVAVVSAAVYDAAANSEAERDTGNLCTEDYNFAYTTTPSANTEEAAHKVYNFFYQLGYTDTNIAGILGNWQVESGIDSTSMELVYDEPFSDMTAKTELNYKKYKNWAEAHEVCKCKWLQAMIDRGKMVPILWKEDDPARPVIKYKYTIPDPEYDNDGNAYTVTDREFAVCYNCTKGSYVECPHGYREHHSTPTGAICTAGYENPCEHGFSEKHHVPAYHDINFRTRCLDWNFTPATVRSPGCETGLDEAGNVRWTLPDDPNVADYDRENEVISRDPSSGNFEGFKLYDTNTNYDTVYCGLGLGQWTNGRNRMLVSYAQRHGLNWYDIETQLAFMIADDGDAAYYRKFLREWEEEPTPEQAAWVFTRKWEGNTTMAINERKLAAASWYVKISEWRRTGNVDTGYGQSIIDMAGASADQATNVAAGVQYESCGEYFNSDNSSAAAAILSYAWPNKNMAENNGTARWRYIKDSVIGPTDGDGKDWKYKSCDRTVATAIRWSGTDDNFPAGAVTEQYNYMSSHDNWQLISWDGNRESLQPGDILIHVGGSEHNHVVMYVGHDLVKAQAAKPEYAGSAEWQATAADESMSIVDGSLSDRSPAVKPFTSSYYTPQRYQVFRCIQPGRGGAYSGISGDAYSGISE